MGSDRKRLDRLPSSSGEDSESSHEHKRPRKEHKKHKKEKHKKDKNKKHKKHSSKGKEWDREQERLVKEAKKFLKQQLKSGDAKAAAAAAAAGAGGRGAGPSEPPAPPYDGLVEPISADEYFTKNTEFAAWLKECRGKFFSEQTTEENRAMFNEFVNAWNSRRLPARFYAGDVALGLGGGTVRTSFAWGIKGAAGTRALAASGAVGMAAALDEELNLKEQARAAVLKERKQQRAEVKEWLDEAVPRLSGKDKTLEEKRARRELSKAGNDSPEHVGRGWDIMGGGGGDSLVAAKAREAARQQQRGRRQSAQQAEVAQRVTAARAAEDGKMAAFRALLQQGPIQIAKRQL